MLKIRNILPVITAILSVSCFSLFLGTVSQNTDIKENNVKIASINEYLKTVSNGKTISSLDNSINSLKDYETEVSDIQTQETMFFARKVLFGWNSSDWGEPKETVFHGNVLDMVITGFDNTSNFQRYATKLQAEGILSFSTVKLSKSEISPYSDTVSEEYGIKIVFNSEIIHDKLLKSDSIMKDLIVNSKK